MTFEEAKLEGAFVVTLNTLTDHRGTFTRVFSAQEFEARGLNPRIVQSNLSTNYKQGTLRGLHYQIAPATETKLVRCLKGSVFDVIVDMRPESPSYLEHFGLELRADARTCLYVPAMFAHGYQALSDGAEVIYHVSEAYAPEYERGLRYNDPALAIDWPLPVTELSQKDRSWPLL